ncbi:MAG: class II fructose-bisphosphate aldolase [Armatimonadota bacterium]
MPVPDAATFARMLDSAQKGDYALASINVTSSTTLNAALAAFAETKTDGIIQFSTGGSEFASGPIKSMSEGAIALAEYTHRVAKDLPCYIALTTDHCVPEKVDKFVKPLIAESKDRISKGLAPLFNGHMFDGSELGLKENMAISQELLKAMAPLGIILEVEAGVVGGEEDGIDNSHVGHEKLYTTPEDMLYVYDCLHAIGRFTLAATFGNVHGVYKPGNVKLDPLILKAGNDAMKAKYGKILDLVFHGGSGSLLSEIHDAVSYGVIKMNVDTDCQYHYSRPVVDHVMKNYDGMLRIDGEMGDKKTYDPRAFMKKAESGMKARVIEAATDLKSVGISLVSG